MDYIIEAILSGLHIKSLEKPLVFITMLFGFILFVILGVGILYLSYESLSTGSTIYRAIGTSSLSLIFFGLAAICGHFVKKCFVK